MRWESVHAPANLVKDESKAVFVWIQATREGIMDDASLFHLLLLPHSCNISDGPQLFKISTESFQVLEN